MLPKLAECEHALAHMRPEANEADWRAEFFEQLVEQSCPDRRLYRCVMIIVAKTHQVRFSDATVRVLQEESTKYFSPDLLIGELYVPCIPMVADDFANSMERNNVYAKVKAFFTTRVVRLPSCVMELKDNVAQSDMCAYRRLSQKRD